MVALSALWLVVVLTIILVMEIFGLFIKIQNQGQSIISKHQMVKFKLVMTTKNTYNIDGVTAIELAPGVSSFLRLGWKL
jgi:hypothetical protein